MSSEIWHEPLMFQRFDTSNGTVMVTRESLPALRRNGKLPGWSDVKEMYASLKGA